MSKTIEERRAKLLKKIAKMSPEEFRRKLKNDSKFVRKMEAIGIITR